MAEALQIVRLSRGAEGDHPLLREAVSEVLRPAFSSAELPDESVLLDHDGHLVSDLLVAKQRSAVVGAASSATPDDAGTVLLEYLAVRPRLRSSGVGSRLLVALRQLWAELGCSVAVGEIHDPRFHEETVDERPISRLRFYQRNGGWLIDTPWVQPSLAPGSARVPGMLLVRLDLDLGAPPPEPVPSGPVVKWAEEYFTESETRRPSDPTYRELIDRLKGPGTVSFLPMDAFTDIRPLDRPVQ